DSWNLPLRHPDGGFLGDRASQSAFRELLDQARRTHATGRRDPFGRTPTAALGKREIDMVLVGGDPDAAHVVHLAVEEYARALAAVVRSFIAQPDWAGVRDIVLGGGFPDHEAGRLAIRRAARLLKLARSGVRLRVLAHDSDEGGLLGWVQLAPPVALRRQAFLAVERSFIAQPDWAGVRDIVLGGGFPDHEAGRRAIRRAARLLKLARSGVRLRVLAHDSDEGGLLGWVQLAPPVALRRQAFLAV